jgi:hypothetical protein
MMQRLVYDVFILPERIERLKNTLSGDGTIQYEFVEPEDQAEKVIPIEVAITESRKRSFVEKSIKAYGKIIGDPSVITGDVTMKKKFYEFFEKNSLNLFIAWAAAFGSAAISAFTTDVTKALSMPVIWLFLQLFSIAVAIGNVRFSKDQN